MRRSRTLVAVCVALACFAVAGQVLSAEGTQPQLSWEEYRDHLGLRSIADVEASPVGKEGGFAVDAAWTLFAAILVFWMQAGFALLETGFTRAKNAVNILMKNLVDFSVGSVAYWLVGFGLMFGATNGFCGQTGFMLSGHENDTWSYTFLIFQTVFAGTSATIVSGALAERTKFSAYILYSLLITVAIYPIFGSWVWGSAVDGSGWLEAPPDGVLDRLGLPPFIDFAGSTVVHSVGAWVGLAGVLFLGPRLGKYGENSKPLRGHSMSLATLGVFILWMGWFGFNCGSTTSVAGGLGPHDGSGKAIGLIAVNTNLGACAGALAAMITVWIRTGKPEIGMTLNGVLAGLVSITASCSVINPISALVIGAIGGVIVVFAVDFFERLEIDDPVGALSVHGICGAWGTIAAALFHYEGFRPAQLATQLIGVISAFVWAFAGGALIFWLLKITIGLRVDPNDEIDGLDLSEHGGEAYPREEF
ncbi:MAG: ammonium transporter [Sorangiineae bacterium NIC37A_2]|nr:MAG: ammonium transporter [Sorangiineae bacterium NIC37A_2]